jgi:hypothetical protein
MIHVSARRRRRRRRRRCCYRQCRCRQRFDVRRRRRGVRHWAMRGGGGDRVDGVMLCESRRVELERVNVSHRARTRRRCRR